MRDRFFSAIVALVLTALIIAPAPGQDFAWAEQEPESVEATARDIAQVESALASMSAAVLAGDASAYMKHVWGGEPHFYREQQAWADDLAAHRPEVFTLSMAADSFRITDSVASVPVEMSWRMPGSPDRSVRFEADLVRMPEALGGPWAYAGEHMIRWPGDKVAVLTEPGDRRIAISTAALMSEVTSHVERGLRHSLDRTAQIRLYPSPQRLAATVSLSAGELDEHWKPGESIKVLAPRPDVPPNETAAALARMYARLVVHELGPQADEIPFWARAGLGELACARFERDTDVMDGKVRRWVMAGQRMPWSELEADDGSEKTREHAREQGHHMLAYIHERFGRTLRNDWFGAMAHGFSPDEASRSLLGLSFEELDRAWFQDLMTIDEPAAADIREAD